MRHALTFTALTCLVGFSLSVVAASSAPPPFRIVQQWKLGGAGGWDYLRFDAGHRRLFVSRGDRVVVVDVDQGKAIGSIAGTEGVHGIALDQRLHRGFTSNGKSDSVTMFDLDTLKPLATIGKTGKGPDAIVYDPSSRHVFTFNGHGHSASVIDPVRRSVIATIPLSGKPEFAAADGRGHIFVNIENTSELAELDTATDKVMHRWPLAACTSPSGLALDVAHARVFSVCDKGVMAVTNARNGHHVATVSIGKGPDAVSFDPGLQTIFSSNGESGTLTVVHEDRPDHYTVSETVKTRVSARTHALDPTKHRIYLSSAVLSDKRNARGWRMPVPGSFTLLVIGTQ